MIEKVARAIVEAGGFNWESDGARMVGRNYARAALEALRETIGGEAMRLDRSGEQCSGASFAVVNNWLVATLSERNEA